MNKLLLCLALAATMVFACTSNNEEPGVIARVNGRPIHLHQLESKYDFMHLNWAGDMNPTVKKLKTDYGRILGDLIVQELVAQALEERGLSVEENELAQAEENVRSDYPKGAFEQVLVEEYIDLKFWREELRARLTLEKFFQEVLRPRVKLNYQEAEAYYREHISDFYLPTRVRFFLIRGPSRDLVKSAANLYREERDVEALSRKFNQVTVQELKMREDALTVSWRNALKGLSPGEAGAILTDNLGFQILILLERYPAEVLDPSRAYPLVEKVLLEQKLRREFDAWLEKELQRAAIFVSPHLRFEDMEIKDEDQEPDTEQEQEPETQNKTEPVAEK
ncbi:MAG: peptidylprolyl isomerase [Thermodesulfobacteriota bacterium]|nr:peptidylprolyl isomerase [Thermodesulfobacteriota bacterium]